MTRQLAGLIVFCVSAPAIAGGPLLLEGPNGNVPATYQDPNIEFNIETGDLGTFPNPAADLLVMDALALWNNITTSTINLSQGADVAANIDDTNFTSYIPDPLNATIHNDDDGLNPIVYDDDGRIIDAFFGVGQGTGPDASVVGFAASSIIIGTRYFTEGFAVVNGNLPPGISADVLKLILAHEIGHYMGLDHTQTDIDNSERFDQGCTPGTDYPLMYPYACRNSLDTHPDDDTALSMLYPQAGYFASQGQLTGRFLTTSGAPVRGANLWVEKQPGGEIFSIVSDYLTQCTGFFALMLPPGDYVLHANSINREFFSGSSVGPYANSPTDLSFQAPASIIGADQVFTADGAVPVFIRMEAGKSVDVEFASDGTGTMTPADSQLDLALIYNSADACSVSSGGDGGGGSPSLPMLAALLLIPALRKRG
jgi:MYXO-CTERM domain-containing protein